jgi:hypothetical protein
LIVLDLENSWFFKFNIKKNLSGAAEVYNSTHRDTDNVHFLRAIDLVDRSKVAIGDDTVLHKEDIKNDDQIIYNFMSFVN